MLTKDTGRVCDALVDVMFTWGRIMRQKMHEWQPDLPFVQFGALTHIADKHPTMTEVAAYLKVAAPAATTIVEELVKRGFISRVHDERDRRVVRLEPTKRGKALLVKSAALKAKFMQENLKELSSAEREKLTAIISKIVDHES